MPRQLTSNALCSRCNTRFTCGAVSDKRCWCMGLAALPAARLDMSKGCLCQLCLAEALEETKSSKR